MPRLSGTGRWLLERARAHQGLVIPPPRTARELGATETLLRQGLLRETRSTPEFSIHWRRDGEGVCWCLIISDDGRRAIAGAPTKP